MAIIEEFEKIVCLEYKEDTFKPFACCGNPKKRANEHFNAAFSNGKQVKQSTFDHRVLEPSKTEHSWMRFEQKSD
ncbi:hypothetical protein GPALN_005781 [Globodera pallida]|nr:hypothetical protein GPALN_005781 [Globodera pallida]